MTITQQIFTFLFRVQDSLATVVEATKKVKGDKDKSLFGSLEAEDFWHAEDFITLMLRLFLHMGFVFLLVRVIYYPIAKRKDFLFTYFLFSITIFLMSFMLQKQDVEMGFALGLFAVFGIMRYRTDAIPIKDMTYLFIVIGMSVMNALAHKKISLAEIVFANLAIVAMTYGLEKVWLMRHESQKIIVYERIDLIQKGRRQELLEDLTMRTGLKINRLEIGKIDFLRDTVLIKLYFYEDQQDGHMDESFTQGFNN